jgi:hypothetical protein
MVECIQLPDNGKLAWKVLMPRADLDTSREEYQCYLVGVALMVLGQATALPQPKFDDLTEMRLKRGLPGRVFSVRPLRELMKLAQPETHDIKTLSSQTRPVLGTILQPIESSELRWRTGPGPGYSWSLAEQHLRSRYETTLRGLRLTLPRIVSDNRCRRLLLRFRAGGALDWQILNGPLNMVAQWQIEVKRSRPFSREVDSKAMTERALREEREDDPQFELSMLTEQRMRMQLMVGVPAAFKTWGLASHRSTPDFNAMKRLLDQRYQHSTDDIPHIDPFLRTASKGEPHVIIL